MSHVFFPTTRLINKTEDELGFCVGEKGIDPGGHADVGYRKGIGGIGPRIHFWVQPLNRPHLRGPKIMPIDLFDHADIDIVYKLSDGSVSAHYQEGALIGFVFIPDTLVRRIGFVRWVGGIYDSFAKFGTCYHAAAVPAPATVEAPPHVQGLAPVETLAEAPRPVQVIVHVEAPTEALPVAVEPSPTPATDHNYEIEIVINSPTQTPAVDVDVPAAAVQVAAPSLSFGNQIAIY